MGNINIIEKGINKIIERSIVFLEDAQEFYPFGIIYKNEEWQDLITYDESLDSITMRDFLIKTIIEDFKQEEVCHFGAVGVFGEIEQGDKVIIIYNTSNGVDWYELMYKYHFENNKVIIDKKAISTDN